MLITKQMIDNIINLDSSRLMDLLKSCYYDIEINESEFSGMSCDGKFIFTGRFQDGLYGNKKCRVEVYYIEHMGKLQLEACL